MNAIRTLSMLWAASLSCALAGCAVAVPEEGEDDPAIEESAGEESESALSEDAEDATSEVSSEIQSEPAEAMGCGGGQNYCLTKCSKTGDNQWHVAGYQSQMTTGCAAAGEAYCRSHHLGYRTHVCWGYVNNN